MREELDRWIVENRVSLSMPSGDKIHEIAVALVDVGGRLQPVMLINSDWIVAAKYADSQRDRRYKELVLYHEYWHLKDHFDGTGRLPMFKLNIDDVNSRVAEYANRIWNAEYRASRAEWQLATRLGVADLVAWAPQPHDARSDERAFLDSFYTLLMQSDQHILDIRLKDAFHAEWKKIYEQEKEKVE